MNKLKPVAIQLNGHVYEIPSTAYLWEGNTLCFALIHKNTLPKRYGEMYLTGDVFLNHFYSVYDFEADTTGLGVNINSKGKAFIWKKGAKPPKKSERLPNSAQPTFMKYTDKLIKH